MFELSKEHEDFRKVVREFAQDEVEPNIATWDRDHHFRLVPKMGELGLFGLVVPEEFGGMGEDGDFTSLCVAIEELGRVDQVIGITLSAGVGLGINPIHLRQPTSRRSASCPTSWPVARSPASASPRLTPARTPATRTRPSATATSGSSTAPRRSSPTPAPTSPPS